MASDFDDPDDWPFDDERPELPDLVVDYTPPQCVGQILGPDGEVLVEVMEDRPEFGFHL